MSSSSRAPLFLAGALRRVALGAWILATACATTRSGTPAPGQHGAAETTKGALRDGGAGPTGEALRRVLPPPHETGNAYAAELAVSGPLAQRLSAWPADLVVLYAGEHRGSLQTCGCPKRPRGSLARLATWNDAVSQRDPSVRTHAGYFLEDAVGFDGVERADVSLGNRYMAQGLALGAWDALNVGFVDLPGLAHLDPALRDALPLVSANVTGPGVRPYVIVERGGRNVGITGITRPGVTLSEPAGYRIAEPVAAAGPVLHELAGKVDVIVLLSYQAETWAQRLAQAHPEVDVVVDANLHRDAFPPATVGHAAWVRASYETMRAGELRLDLDARNAVVGARDRKIDLDPDMPDRPDLAALQREARAAMDVEQQRIFGGP